MLARLIIAHTDEGHIQETGRLAELLRADQLSPEIVMLALSLALAFGAIHAFSPGHGKSIVAAYLVGQRSSISHAILLGVIVTLTHTVSVFVLGFGAFFASKYVEIETIMPILGIASALIILGIGAILLVTRGKALLKGDDHDHEHEHSHLPEDSTEGVSLSALIWLGITGGIVPCPSALVLLLLAVYLNRIPFGLMLIAVFSIGLGAVLVGIGVLTVKAKKYMERFSSSEGKAAQYLPFGSAVIITIIGIIMLVRAY